MDFLDGGLTGEEDEFGGVGGVVPVTKHAVLEVSDLDHFLLVARLLGTAIDLFEGFRDDSDEEVEKQDQVENGAEEPDKPIHLTVKFNIAIEFTECSHIRLLPGANVGHEVLLVR